MNKSSTLLILSLCLCWHSCAGADTDMTEQQPPATIENPDDIQGQAGDKDAADHDKADPHAGVPQFKIIVGEPLPLLVIDDYGEVIIGNEDEVLYQPWRSDKPLKRVQLIHYLAGRRSASKRHKNFSDQLEALELDFQKHHVTTIINADDAFLGTSKLVASRLDNSKRDYPEISVVGDKFGIGAHSWSLKRKGSAIIIVNAKGIVLFFKEDKFKQAEIDSTLELLQSQMAQ